MKQPLTNVAASVRQRLLNLAQKRGEEFQSLLIRYTNERLIYRLAASAHVDDFILKGAMLLYVWSPHPFRATQDVDLLGRGAVTAERLADVFRGLCTSKVADDGLAFQADTVRVGLIRQEDEYGGFRVKLEAKLTAARIDLQVDVGVGDAVAQVSTIDYPTLLELPAPRLRAYSREAAIAEKFHAMVDHGLENSRMKDFFDVWALSREFAFEGAALAAAIGATFERRGTPIPASNPRCLHAGLRSGPDQGQAVEGLPRARPSADGAASVRGRGRARWRIPAACRGGRSRSSSAQEDLAGGWLVGEPGPLKGALAACPRGGSRRCAE